ncbi:MAG: hypothetical protein IJ668_01090 [Selenomonadaceae bacterium]|nr:hypothetical protein [Selenomonadaceae bacterium]
MLKLNIRHSLPQIGLRIQHSRVEQAHDEQPVMHTNRRQARSNKGSTQAELGADSYRSRHSYGNTNMTDFTRENGQRGIGDVQSAVAAHARESWSMIENAAKSGNYIRERAEQIRQADIMEQRYLVAGAIPDPITTVEEPSRYVGDIDTGDTDISFDLASWPTIQITTGSVETYIRDRGFLRQWTTQDRFDIYA